MATLPDNLPWDQALERLGTVYLDPTSPLALSSRDLAAQFIPPGMEWLRDWRTLQTNGVLPENSVLVYSQRLARFTH